MVRYRNVLKCRKCNMSVYSSENGELVKCGCESVGVRETPDRLRLYGDMEHMLINRLAVEVGKNTWDAKKRLYNVALVSLDFDV